jgi:hypothetical protein
MAEDPTRLWVQATGSTHPLDQKFDIYYLKNNVPTRVNLCGFSFFGELNGLLVGADEGINLRSPADGGGNAADLTGPVYDMKFEYYLDQLKASRINFMRVWIFNDFPVRVYPFQRAGGLYQLHLVSQEYLTRLSDFISRARDRGIVVCLTLSARQALQTGSSRAWETSPFNSSLNDNGIIVGGDNGGFDEFCDIEEPPFPHAIYNDAWNPKQKLHWVQRNLFTKIVEASRPYWNVMFEIMNEPSQNMKGVVDWHVTVGTWLKNLLWDTANNRRKRLVVINAPDNLIDNSNANLRLVERMQSANLADVFSFHGGQWGGRSGRPVDLCHALDITPSQHVSDIVDGIFGSPGIKDAMQRFSTRPFALLFDSDALYWAQNLPKNYVQETLNVDGSFNYRWNFEHLHRQTNHPNCNANDKTQPGFPQRLALINQALNKDRITVF